ncbi:MAG TPA: alpha/beta hydrolase [Actinomycetota bacterium]|jgi:acetyl esterase/lipase
MTGRSLRRLRVRVATALFLGVVGLAVPLWHVPAGAAGFDVQRGLRYGTGPNQELDAYVPSGARNLPGVIIIHGGGWNSGKKEDAEWLGDALVQNGFVAFSIDYRLAPRYPFPAAINDVRTAITWVRSNAREFGVDPSRLAAIGGSAGGQLASLAAMIGKGPLDVGSRVAAAASISGPQDMALLATSNDPRIQNAVFEYLGCSNADNCQKAGREASPIQYVDPTDPPILLTNSSEEFVPVEQATDMDAALTKEGVDHQLLIIPGDTHGLSERRAQPVFDFLRSELLGIDAPSSSVTPPPTRGPSPPGSRPPVRPSEPRRPETRSTGIAMLPILAIAAAAFAVGLVAAFALGRRRRAVTAPALPPMPPPPPGAPPSSGS